VIGMFVTDQNIRKSLVLAMMPIVTSYTPCHLPKCHKSLILAAYGGVVDWKILFEDMCNSISELKSRQELF
jgi:hypothetical protein